jgi:hypothetical protein
MSVETHDPAVAARRLPRSPLRFETAVDGLEKRYPILMTTVGGRRWV